MRIYTTYGIAIDVQIGGRDGKGNAYPSAHCVHDGSIFYLPISWMPEEKVMLAVAHWAGSEGHSLSRPLGFKGFPHNNSGDVHALTAKLLLEKDDISSEERRLGKKINFGVIYGMGTERIHNYLSE